MENEIYEKLCKYKKFDNKCIFEYVNALKINNNEKRAVFSRVCKKLVENNKRNDAEFSRIMMFNNR